MTIRRKFEKYFSVEHLKEIFSKYIVYSRATGIDNLDQQSFRSQLDDQIEILSRKVLAGSYKFTKYKLKLLSKGKNKFPREISIPTVRDRIALRSLCDFLNDIYKESIQHQLPQKIIKNIKDEIDLKNYNGCIKLDVANFYPSIKHKELISRLGKKIRNKEIKGIILSSISSPTVSISRESDEPTKIGVPQGLAISNILAAIYLSNIDKNLRLFDGIKYFRYVDDVLILCDLSKAEEISKKIISQFKKIGLKVYDPIDVSEKSKIGPIANGFDYLGYQFCDGLVGVRIGSVEKLKNSLVSIFTSYKYSKKKNNNFLLWRLNLRITGCIYENKSKGWLFFFSEINDEKLLHSLDHYVKKLAARFNVDITPKKFVRAFKELRHRKYETKYIPNFDNYSLEEQKSVLVDYFSMNIERCRDEEIEFEFKKRLSRQVRDLQVDILDFSYS